jgi:hypothetical protein
MGLGQGVSSENYENYHFLALLALLAPESLLSSFLLLVAQYLLAGRVLESGS